MPEIRRKYDREFREGAVRIVEETGKPIAQVARDLGVNEGTLGNWVARAREVRDGTQGLSSGDVEELKRLRAEKRRAADGARCAQAIGGPVGEGGDEVSVARFVAGRLPSARDPGGIYITPEQDVRSVRTAPLEDRHRLLIITGEHFTPGARHVTERWERLLVWTAERFPGVEITYRWATQDNGTTDQLPYVGLFHPGARHVYVATGFGGWGTSSGIMAGHLLAASSWERRCRGQISMTHAASTRGARRDRSSRCRPTSPDILWRSAPRIRRALAGRDRAGHGGRRPDGR